MCLDRALEGSRQVRVPFSHQWRVEMLKGQQGSESQQAQGGSELGGKVLPQSHSFSSPSLVAV